MSFEIVTDSSANLTDSIIDQYGIHILSLIFRVGQEEHFSYIKGEVTRAKPFYERMRQGDIITTGLINMQLCREVFESILKNGSDILYIGFSSALSGTYDVGAMTARQLQEEYPERRIIAIDSLAASMGEGLLVYHAAMLREKGKTLDEVHAWLEENILHLCHWFTVGDLQYLRRGGRISATSAIVGNLLRIKPIMHVDDAGRLVPVGKIMGRRESLNELVKKMKETCIRPEEQTIAITHGDCLEDAEYVVKMIRDSMHVKDVIINYVDLVVGAHCGPGTIALFFMGTKR